MVEQRNVRVTGPLAPYALGFKEALARQGYRSSCAHLGVMSQASRWLSSQELGAEDLSISHVEKFATWRRTAGYVTNLSIHRVTLLLDYLTSVGVVTPVELVTEKTPLELVMARYTRYLIGERGLSASSVRNYVEMARTFLSWLPVEGELELAGLNTAAITRFVLAECQRCKVSSAKVMTTRLRSLLRFFYLEGLTPIALAPAVPAVASWRQSSLPKALNARDVARLLKSCDRRRPTGQRDFAVLMLLSRLGLRAGEVAGLQLSDIDWRHGGLVIRGKGNREDRLPLPVDVGEAIVAWLQRGRPRCENQLVFTKLCGPPGARTRNGISAIVYRACERAELPAVGAHCLRHTAATQMLQAGGSLAEVGQVLRHRSPETTSLYAKVNRRSLVAVVRSWPGRS